MRPTASSLWLAEICPASHTLPQVRETTAAQEKGSWIHKYLELAPQTGKEAALAQLPEEYRELCAELDPSIAPMGRREVALVYDLVNRIGTVGSNIAERNYPTAPDVACGTADVLGDHWIWDYKSGRPGPAKDSLQLLSLGLYAARAMGWDFVEVGHLRVDGDRLWPDSTVLHGIDLAAVHARVARIYERYEAAKAQAVPDVSPGAHCSMCSAAPGCPATMALTKQVSEALALPEADQREMVTIDPAKAWHFAKRAEDLIERLRVEIKRQAQVRPVDLGNGKELRLVPIEKTRIDGKVALPILRDAIGERADAACSVSKTALAKAVGKGSAAVLVERLTAAGAIVETTEQHLREVTKDKERAA